MHVYTCTYIYASSNSNADLEDAYSEFLHEIEGLDDANS